jgi:hypothetical protein
MMTHKQLKDIANSIKELTAEISSLKEKVEDLSTGAVVVVRTPPPKYIPEKEKPVVTDDWEKDFGRSQEEEEEKIKVFVNNPPGENGTIHVPEPYFVKESEVFESWEKDWQKEADLERIAQNEPDVKCASREDPVTGKVERVIVFPKTNPNEEEPQNDFSHNDDTIGFSSADWNHSGLDSDVTTTDTARLSEEDLKRVQDCTSEEMAAQCSRKAAAIKAIEEHSLENLLEGVPMSESEKRIELTRRVMSDEKAVQLQEQANALKTDLIKFRWKRINDLIEKSDEPEEELIMNIKKTVEEQTMHGNIEALEKELEEHIDKIELGIEQEQLSALTLPGKNAKHWGELFQRTEKAKQNFYSKEEKKEVDEERVAEEKKKAEEILDRFEQEQVKVKKETSSQEEDQKTTIGASDWDRVQRLAGVKKDITLGEWEEKWDKKENKKSLKDRNIEHWGGVVQKAEEQRPKFYSDDDDASSGINLSKLKDCPEKWREMLQKMNKEKKCGPKKEFELEMSKKEDKFVETTVALPQYEVTNLSDQEKEDQ